MNKMMNLNKAIGRVKIIGFFNKNRKSEDCIDIKRTQKDVKKMMFFLKNGVVYRGKMENMLKNREVRVTSNDFPQENEKGNYFRLDNAKVRVRKRGEYD